jgi:hypothetical protein
MMYLPLIASVVETLWFGQRHDLGTEITPADL